MKLWRGRTAQPAFGISKGFYLSVLSAKARLPAPIEIVNPKGAGGAVQGFIAPMTEGEDTGALQRPMHRGVYAISSLDRKTVLRWMVVPKEEAGFDPAGAVQTAGGSRLSREIATRIQATWTLMQLSFESYDPAVYPAVRLMLSIAARAARLTDGVVADPVSQAYRLPESVLTDPPPGSQINAADVVRAHSRAGRGGLHVYTLGLGKFHLPELEINSLEDSSLEGAQQMLLDLAQSALMGNRIAVGGRIGSPKSPLLVAEGGHDRAIFEGIPALELVPAGGATASECVEAWVRDA